MRRGYSDPVVRDGEVPITIRFFCEQFNGRSLVIAPALDGVPQEVLKHLSEMAFPHLDRREFADRGGCPALACSHCLSSRRRLNISFTANATEIAFCCISPARGSQSRRKRSRLT